MRILDLFKSFKPKTQKLELDPATAQEWPEQIIAHLGIDKEFSNFQENVADIKQHVEQSLTKFTDDNTLAAVPERARTMSALHGQEFTAQTRKLLATASFENPFNFEQGQDTFLEANNNYKTLVTKNTSALKEFFSDELKITQTGLQELEDAIIKFTTALEQLKFPQVRKAKDMQMRIKQLQEKSDRYRQLLESLNQDLKRTKEKRTKIGADMQVQQALIRNTDALAALQKSEKIEQDLHTIVAKYVSVCDDIRNVVKNNSRIKIQPSIKQVYDELPKDPFQFLATEHEKVKDAFEDAICMLEEEKPGNVKNLITRLSALSRDAQAQGRKIATMLPDQRALKRDIVKDIAALQVYDKQQFFMRAQTEEEIIQNKIEFLNNELDPNKLAAMQQELNALVRELGARIKGDIANATSGNYAENNKNASSKEESEKKETKNGKLKKEESKIEIVDIPERTAKTTSEDKKKTEKTEKIEKTERENNTKENKEENKENTSKNDKTHKKKKEE